MGAFQISSINLSQIESDLLQISQLWALRKRFWAWISMDSGIRELIAQNHNLETAEDLHRSSWVAPAQVAILNVDCKHSL